MAQFPDPPYPTFKPELPNVLLITTSSLRYHFEASPLYVLPEEVGVVINNGEFGGTDPDLKFSDWPNNDKQKTKAVKDKINFMFYESYVNNLCKCITIIS